MATGIGEAQFVNLAGAGGEITETIKIGVKDESAVGLPAVNKTERRARDRLATRHAEGPQHRANEEGFARSEGAVEEPKHPRL